MKMPLFEPRITPLIQAETLWTPPVHLLRLTALGAIVALAAGLRFANLEALGYANHYYTAAVSSMLQSWSNFFFVAAEPGGAVSVDKPPLGLWLQTISAYFFGVNGFAVLLPELVAGLLAVVVVYHLVRRSFGTAAGLLAALALAITPVVVATDRNNIVDSPLILMLLLAAWAFIKATENGRLRYLLLGAVLVGLGFNIKMLQAYLPLPAFYALYFFGAAERLWPKIAHLALATALLLAVSLSWAIAVDLTPADQRPYVGSSDNNSVLNLALGYNGLERLTRFNLGRDRRSSDEANSSVAQPGVGPTGSPSPIEPNVNSLSGQDQSPQIPPPGSDPSPSRSGRPGPGRGGSGGGSPGLGQAGALRLFTAPLSKQISWLLPFGLFSAALLGFRTRLHWPLAPGHQALVLWGGWLLTGGSALSIAQHFHEYYLSMLGAPLAALFGIGVVEPGRLHAQRPWLAIGLLLAAAGGTLGLQFITVVSFASATWWLLPTIALFVVGAGVLIISAIRSLRRGIIAGFSCIVAALLIIPGVWSGLTTLGASANQSLGGGRSSGAMNQGGLRVNQALLDYLEPRTQNITYLMAVPSSMQGADYVIATGRPVLYLGGFKGTDPVVTADDLARLVATDKLRYVYWGGGRGPGGGSSNISTWVTAHCMPVEEVETTTANTEASAGPPGAKSPGDNSPSSSRGGTLYNCSG